MFHNGSGPTHTEADLHKETNRMQPTDCQADTGQCILQSTVTEGGGIEAQPDQGTAPTSQDQCIIQLGKSSMGQDTTSTCWRTFVLVQTES